MSQDGFSLKYYKKCDLKCQIIGAATEANLRKNGLYLVMVSSNASSDLVELNIQTRIRYIDN